MFFLSTFIHQRLQHTAIYLQQLARFAELNLSLKLVNLEDINAVEHAAHNLSSIKDHLHGPSVHGKADASVYYSQFCPHP